MIKLSPADYGSISFIYMSGGQITLCQEHWTEENWAALIEIVEKGTNYTGPLALQDKDGRIYRLMLNGLAVITTSLKGET